MEIRNRSKSMDTAKPTGLDNFPNVNELMVKELDKLFPLRSPDVSWPERRIWIEVGQRRVIDFLIEKMKEQNENVLA